MAGARWGASGRESRESGGSLTTRAGTRSVSPGDGRVVGAPIASAWPSPPRSCDRVRQPARVTVTVTPPATLQHGAAASALTSLTLSHPAATSSSTAQSPVSSPLACALRLSLLRTRCSVLARLPRLPRPRPQPVWALFPIYTRPCSTLPDPSKPTGPPRNSAPALSPKTRSSALSTTMASTLGAPRRAQRRPHSRHSRHPHLASAR